MHDRSSDDAGSLSWLVGEHVGEHVIKPKMRTFRGHKRQTGKQKRKSAGVGGASGPGFRAEKEEKKRCKVTSCL